MRFPHTCITVTGARTPSGIVPVESRVAVAIRLLAGASYLDLLDVHGIHKSTAYECLWAVVDAINNTKDLGDIVFPRSTTACTKLAAGFEVRVAH